MRLSVPGVRGPVRIIPIRLQGNEIEGRDGDTVASALVAAGQLACRTTRSGQSRGVFCGMGVCQECVMMVDGRPARACMTPIRDGMDVERLAADALPEPTGGPGSFTELAPEVLVIGAGPAGLAAAAAAAEAGAEVVLIDERSKAGGQYFKQPSAGLADERLLDRQYRQGHALIRRVQQAGVRILAGVQVWGAAGPSELFAVGPDAALVLRPQRLVIATGAYERGVPLPGWTLPGFMTTGAAQTLMRAYQVVPGRRVLVSGNGPLNLQVAAELVQAGATVVAICETAPAASVRRAPAALKMALAAPDLMLAGFGYLRTLRRAGVPTLPGHAVIGAEGDGQVSRATVAALDKAGRPIAGSERTFEVDAVCAGFGFVPANELARSLGVEHRYDTELGQLVTVRDARGRTPLDGVWVVGDGGGVGGARLAKATGMLAGVDVAESLGRRVSPSLAAARRRAERDAARNRRFQGALAELYAAPRLVDQLADPGTLICRCEEVSVAEMKRGFASGITSLGALKRVTRAGMGRCQGRYCAPILAELAARRSGRPIEESDWFAPAPPFKPLPVDLVVAATAGLRPGAPERMG